MLEVSALILWLAAGACAADAPESTAAKVQQLYDQAFRSYTSGDYARAIQTWNDVLRLDPDQKTARRMVLEVQEGIKKKNAKRLAAVYGRITAGRYRSALAGLETLLENGSQPVASPALQAQLEDVSRIVPQVPARTKAWTKAALAVDAAIGAHPNLTLAYNGLRYAQELDPREERIGRLLDWFRSQHPELASVDLATPGMAFLEYKRSHALSQIYAGQHHLAIDILNEVLALEPDDIVALKRLGSAYYSLGLKDKARNAWGRALKLSPGDGQLKKFLLKTPTQKE